jgi:hypothetical protein
LVDERGDFGDVSRFWDGLVRGERAEPGHVDPATAETIRRLQSLASAPLPVSARERARARVVAGTASRTDEQRALFDDRVLRPSRPTSPNGHAAARAWRAYLPALPVSQERRRWAMAQLATALLPLVTLFAIFIAFRPGNSEVAAPVDHTPTPISAPAVPAVVGEPLLNVGLAGWDWSTGTASDVRPANRIDLMRLTLAPGAPPYRDLPGTGPGTRIEYVESGLFDVTLDTAGGRLRTAKMEASPVAAGSTVRLGPGDALVVPGGTLRTIGNAGQTPATMIEVAEEAVDPFVRMVAGLHPGELPTAPLAIRLDRVVLAPGASLPRPADGTTELVHVEEGVVEMTRTGPGAGAIAGRPFTYRTGGGITIGSDPTVATDLRNVADSPTVLLVATFAPA